MNNDSLKERRAWFRHFPEGNVEFIMILRVLIVGVMAATALLRGTQRPMGSVGLLGLICADYLLQTWWFVQMKCDMAGSLSDPPVPARQTARARVITSLLASLPTAVAFLLLAPWAEVAIRDAGARASIMRVAQPVIGVLFVATAIVGMQALRRIRLADHATVVLWLVPVAHVFIAQRLIRITQNEIRVHRQTRDLPVEKQPQLGAILTAANVLGVLMLIPWVFVIRVWGTGDAFEDVVTGRILVLSGAFLTALFSTVQLAAMENLQRQFVGLIQGRKET